MTRAQIGGFSLALSAMFLTVGAEHAAGSKAQDWPQFRGLNRDGVSTETGLQSEWPEGGPKEAWRVSIGEGYSGISVVGDRLYTMYAAELDGKELEFAAAFDATDGKEIWRTAVGDNFENQFGDGPRSTPSVDGDTVFALGSLGDLVALATEDGKQRWKLSLTEAFGSKVPTFGFSTSALVDRDQLVLEAGGPDGKSYVALDKKTGEVRWTFGEAGNGPGYNSALSLSTEAGQRYVYIANGQLVCIDRDGNEVWNHAWPQGETHAMPLHLAPNRIFASGTEGVGGTMFEVDESGDGGSVQELWKDPHMRNHFSSSVVHDGQIYGFDNATLKCISAEDHAPAWGKRGLGKGSLIYADGHIYVLSDLGKLLLIEATPEGYREKGSVQALEGRCWTAPSISNGRLYLRNDKEMVAYDVKG